MRVKFHDPWFKTVQGMNAVYKWTICTKITLKALQFKEFKIEAHRVEEKKTTILNK